MLLSSSQKLQVVLAAAITTNQLPVIASYAEHKNDATTLTPASTSTTTNSTTAVDVIAAPATNYLRQIKHFSVFNSDTVAATVTVRMDDGGSARNIIKVLLWVNWRLEYEPGIGWRVFDSAGAPVTEPRPDKLAEPQQLSNSAGSLYSNPAGVKTTVRGILLHNTDTGAQTVQINVVPDSAGSLGTAAASNRVFKLALAADESVTLEFPIPVVLTDTNDSIQGLSTTASKVTAILFGEAR